MQKLKELLKGSIGLVILLAIIITVYYAISVPTKIIKNYFDGRESQKQFKLCLDKAELDFKQEWAKVCQSYGGRSDCKLNQDISDRVGKILQTGQEFCINAYTGIKANLPDK